MQFSAKCTIIIQGSCYLHSRTWCIFSSFKQFLDQNVERERFTYCVLEHISLMHMMFLQSVEVAQDAGWIHLWVFTFTSPVGSLEKCENILGTVLLLNLDEILIYKYINIYIDIYIYPLPACASLQLHCSFHASSQSWSNFHQVFAKDFFATFTVMVFLSS